MPVNAGEAGCHRTPNAVVILGPYSDGLQACEDRAPGRGSAVRIISARKANGREIREYERNARQN